MAYLFNEVARQHAVNTRTLLGQRKEGRIAVITFSYLFVSVVGVAAAALVVSNSRGDAVLVCALIAAPVLFVALFVSHSRIRRIEKSLDQSLDVIAATRAMATQAGVPTNEQDQLRDIFYDLQDQRSRGFFGEKRALF